MSQHFVRLHCTRISAEVIVQLGWDRPLSEFYMVVFAAKEKDGFNDDHPVYSNLNDDDSIGKELDYYKRVARQIGCEIPDVMWRAAYQDREFNVVNKIVHYSKDGNVLEAC